jgi:hypothetical protein
MIRRSLFHGFPSIRFLLLGGRSSRRSGPGSLAAARFPPVQNIPFESGRETLLTACRIFALEKAPVHREGAADVFIPGGTEDSFISGQ